MLGSRSEVLPPLYQDGCKGDMALAGPLCSSAFAGGRGEIEALKLKQVMRAVFVSQNSIPDKKAQCCHSRIPTFFVPLHTVFTL
jgi:hypothetical protein